MRSRTIGGVLLIVGTSIGGGMLALPIANAETGFWGSTLFLFLSWIVMTLGAFAMLEANLYLPSGTNILSMTKATLGNRGLLVAWLSYLFLLYTLLSAYISGGGDIFRNLLSFMGLQLNPIAANSLFTVLFGLIVAGGIRQVDWFNRFLMFGKLSIYALLIIFITPKVESTLLTHGSLSAMSKTIMILITSFGFAIIIPNLREYFQDNIKTLRQVIFIGSLIPLLCYIAWDLVIMGSIPQETLASLLNSPTATSGLGNMLSEEIKNPTIMSLFHFFSSICMLTAFLGVALCLSSFFSDGLKISSEGKQGALLFLLTFGPPFCIVTVWPGAYLHALNYAGLFCVILLLLLPALMLFYGRKKFNGGFKVPGGLFTPVLLVASSVLLIGNMMWQMF